MDRLTLLVVLVAGAGFVVAAQQPPGVAAADALYVSARLAIGTPDALAAVSTVSIEGKRRIRSQSRDSMDVGSQRLFFALPQGFLRTLRPDAAVSGMKGRPGEVTFGFSGDRRIARLVYPSPGQALRTLDEAAERAALASSKRLASVLLAGLLLDRDGALPLTYSADGVATSPDGTADVLDARSGDDFHLRVLLDQTSHRVLLVMPSTPVALSASVAGAGGERWFFSDYHRVGSLTLPGLVVIQANGRAQEEWDLSTIRVNAPLPGDLKTPPAR
jgi:hypothetical protein